MDNPESWVVVLGIIAGWAGAGGVGITLLILVIWILHNNSKNKK
jgi:hypothetical protein